MRRPTFLAAGLIAVHAATAALGCTDSIADPDLVRLNERLLADDEAVAEDAAAELQARFDAGNAGFCSGYNLGRHYTRAEDYETARAMLEQTIERASAEDFSTVAPWNVIGFTYLMEGNYDAALDAFETQRTREDFAELPQGTRMKVLNNAGFAHLQLGRYQDAIERLEAARDLGSSVAVKNLAAVRSILKTQESGDIDSPGVFTTVVASLAAPDTVEAERQSVAEDLGIPVDAISVFVSGNGYYALTYDAYVSFPKAEELRKMAAARGFPDAYVSSVAEWTDVTADLGTEAFAAEPETDSQ